MRRRNLLVVLLVLTTFIGCDSSDREGERWLLVYRNDANGDALYGEKSVLIDAVRNGLPIRVGFGGRSQRDTTQSVEHLADAQFISILDGDEVFAQISQIIGQAPATEVDGAKIRFRTNNKWTTIRGTNGYTTGLMVDYMADTLVGRPRDSQRGTSWFVYAKEAMRRNSKPLYD